MLWEEYYSYYYYILQITGVSDAARLTKRAFASTFCPCPFFAALCRSAPPSNSFSSCVCVVLQPVVSRLAKVAGLTHKKKNKPTHTHTHTTARLLLAALPWGFVRLLACYQVTSHSGLFVLLTYLLHTNILSVFLIFGHAHDACAASRGLGKQCHHGREPLSRLPRLLHQHHQQ